MSSSRIRIGLVASALVAVALVVWWRAAEPVASEPESVRAEPASASPGVPPPSPAPAERPAEPLAPSSVGQNETTGDGGHARELALIDAAVVTYAVESLPSLAAYLTHADATVREAARDGFLQMGLTEGAAHLRAAADKIRDPREAVQLLDAADYLDLPSVSVTGGRALIPVSPKTKERLERERTARSSGSEALR